MKMNIVKYEPHKFQQFCNLFQSGKNIQKFNLPGGGGGLEWCNISGVSGQTPLFRNIRLTELTEGILCGSQTRCDNSCSLISQANIPGFSCLNLRIFFTTVGVATCYKIFITL